MAIGTKSVVHIAFVVKDIEAVVDKWSRLLGLEEKPDIWNIPGPDVAPTLTNGKPELYHNCRIGVIKLDNLALEIVQPGEEDSPWKTFLEKHGEGFQHMAFLVPDEKEARKTIKEISGAESEYHIGYYPGQAYMFFDTFDALKTELNIKVDGDYKETIAKLQKEISGK
ncbi:VOC family protein [Butyrivibrio sp. INlla21]|uniref:VOC family protein n=1 Tax=Butyrivibrio sp. INlla21 TaxID=1520811 RepID=UPI0008E70C60|nr:VOC family protein [Butyrivibrio sp. INlla21]SFU88472.1 Catechol 2,3-dioxygenase [Butyrivibrio sp. INlla21]